MSKSETMASNPLFMFGMARSGTNLLARTLNMHSEVMVAIHAFLPLYRSLRKNLLRADASAVAAGVADPNAAIHDGHFDATQRRALDVVHGGSLETAFDGSEAATLAQKLQSRSSDDAADLSDGIAVAARGPTYREMFDSGLDLIRKVRRAESRKWVGMLDTWVIDLMPTLARSYPNAKFIAIERDPRAIANSMLGYVNVDPSQVGHILSVARHWRKQAAVLRKFAQMPEIGPRLLVVRYENLVRDPQSEIRRACAFLGLSFEPSMLEFDQFIDIPTGRKWGGNSTFDSALGAISTAPLDRWQKTLPAGALKLIEYAVGPDLDLLGYKRVMPDAAAGAWDAEILDFLVADGSRVCGWRCDSGDPLLDLAWERLRRDLLRQRSAAVAAEACERCFLYPAYFEALRGP